MIRIIKTNLLFNMSNEPKLIEPHKLELYKKAFRELEAITSIVVSNGSITIENNLDFVRLKNLVKIGKQENL